MDKKPDPYLPNASTKEPNASTKEPNASTKEIRKLRLERYKLWHCTLSDIYKGAIWIIFSALISVAIFYLNKFENFDWQGTLDTLVLSFVAISALYFAACLMIIGNIETLIFEINTNF